MIPLITGRGTAGSWQIRGVQLGDALGAPVRALPELLEALRLKPSSPTQVGGTVCGAPAVLGVKRLPDELVGRLQGVPLIWDIVDAWPQPHGNGWPRRACTEWLRSELHRLRPAAVIAATAQMASDVAELTDVPVLWLPHHHRPGITPNPIRERIQVVGYEGAENYIEPWRRDVERECKRIGARFVVNPTHLADVDVVLALRGSAGYAPRNWKSGVKLANAHGSGTPWIGVRERGYLEIATGAEYWADSAEELRVALDWLADQSAREQVADRFRRAAFGVEDAATRLREWLCGLNF